MKDTSFKKTVSKDSNRDLMIAYKYNRINKTDLNKLENNLSKLIYKIISNNNFKYDDFYDVYNEIWLKIARFKESWDENRDTYVSTWITVLSNNVCYTLKRKQITRNKVCLLNDIVRNDDEGATGDEYGDMITEHDDDHSIKLEQDDFWSKFRKKLSPTEKVIVDLIAECTPKKVIEVCGVGSCTSRVTKNYLTKRTGLRNYELNCHFDKIRRKYLKELQSNE